MNHERIVAIIADIEKYLQDFDEIKIPITASGGVFHVIITRMGFLMLENPPIRISKVSPNHRKRWGILQQMKIKSLKDLQTKESFYAASMLLFSIVNSCKKDKCSRRTDTSS